MSKPKASNFKVMGQPLFKIHIPSNGFDVPPANAFTGNKLYFDGVYINGLHSIRQIELENTEEKECIIVQLRSNLGDQLMFQLENENLNCLADSDAQDELSSNGKLAKSLRMASNSVEAAYKDFYGSHFNEMFNYVDHIKEIELKPKERKSLVVLYMPKENNNSSYGDQDLVESNSASLLSEKFYLRETSGYIFLSGYRKKIEHDSNNFEIDYQTAIRVIARWCKSVFVSSFKPCDSIDVDILYGEPKEIQFEVCNLSEIDLFFKIHTRERNFHEFVKIKPLDSTVRVFDIAEGTQIFAMKGFARVKFALQVSPSLDVGEHLFHILLENIHNYSNNQGISLRIVSRIKPRTEKLKITIPQHNSPAATSPNTNETSFLDPNSMELDFGNTYTGLHSRRRIVLKNVTDKPLDVHLSAEVEGGSVFFSLHLEELTGSNNLPPGSPTKPQYLFGSAALKKQSQHNNASVTHSASTSRASTPDLREPLDPSLVLSTLEKTMEILQHSSLNQVMGVPMSPGAEYEDMLDRMEEADHAASAEIEKALSHNRSRSLEEELDLGDLESLRDEYMEPEDAVSQGEGAANTDVVLEEYILKPGTERTFDIDYCPEKQTQGLLDLNVLKKLTRKRFKLILKYCTLTDVNRRTERGKWDDQAGSLDKDKNNNLDEGWEKKFIGCKAKVCTSLIEITPRQELNFGECNIGQLKSMPLKIENLSELPARVLIKFSSKVLNCYRQEIFIAAKQATEVKMEIYPRKINSDYRKQILISNLLNHDNDQTLHVLSNNIDRNRISYHSLFYKISMKNETNFLDFGYVPLNCSSLRTISFRNITDYPIKAVLTSSSPMEMQLFVINFEKFKLQFEDQDDESVKDNLSSKNNEQRKEKLIELMEVRHLQKIDDDKKDAASQQNQPSLSLNRENSFTEVVDTSDYLDLAQNKKSSIQPIQYFRSPSQENLKSSQSQLWINTSEELVSLIDKVEQSFIDISTHSTSRQFDEDFVKNYLAAKKDLQLLVEEKYLLPISGLELPAKEQQNVILVFTPIGKNRPYVQEKSKKQDIKLFINLTEYEASIVQNEMYRNESSDQEENDLRLPVREFLIRSSLCRSVLDIRQKNINFGLVGKKEKLTKTIVMYNRSEVALFYHIKKSGSIASSDLFFAEGKYGYIRAFSKKEITFVFNPSLPGLFQEKVTFENMDDRENDQFVIVKAHVRKPSNFFIESLNLDFGPVLYNTPALSYDQTWSQNIVISNTSSQNRTFEVYYDKKSLRFGWFNIELSFEVTSSHASVMTKEEEEQVEHLEQKLKIAKRKGRRDKVVKIMEKLAKLKGTPSETDQSQSPELYGETFMSDDGSRPNSSLGIAKPKQSDEALVFGIDSKTTKIIKVNLIITPSERVGSLSGPSSERDYHEKVGFTTYDSSTGPSVDKLYLSNGESDFSFKEHEIGSPSENNRSRIVSGSIFVNEKKNKDVIKTITFSVLVCFDQEVYGQTIDMLQ
ncbi:hypothetical protein MP638_001891 [Amoeboaphelidium occidentale]|nr:hypothetical protein MP638_001891 [Amoeboaphelidium occidentale]